LRAHPEVYIPATKEVHYFSWHFHRSVRWYARRFAEGAGKVCGEITTEYGELPVSRIRLIRTMMPDVRPILIVRNPVDRAWAHAKQSLMFRRGRRYAEVGEREFMNHLRSRASRTAGDYLTALQRWQSVFADGELLVGFYDEIESRPKELLTCIFRHIGVTTDIDWERIPYREYQEKAREREAAVATTAPEALHDLWQWSDYNAAPVPDRFRPTLTAMYREQIEALVQMFGERVGAWKC
jgi:hypothetical protein